MQAYLAVELDRQADSDADQSTFRAVEELIALYQLSKDEMDSRIRAALRNLERSDIGTIHSFAANLLRLYPIEAGVDPQFREDDGSEFDRLFASHGTRGSIRNWRSRATREDWRKVLARCRSTNKSSQVSSAAETVISSKIQRRKAPRRYAIGSAT